jgi:hypothetical protein
LGEAPDRETVKGHSVTLAVESLLDPRIPGSTTTGDRDGSLVYRPGMRIFSATF